MTIPTNITTELAALKAQVTAAAPLSNAPFAAVKAMQLNAGNLVNDIQSALTATSILDTWVAPTDPISMINGFNLEVTAGNDQGSLALIRGVVGRVASNLDQLV